MSAQLRSLRAATAAASVANRIEAFAWEGVSGTLDTRGSVMMERLLSPDECRALTGLYADKSRFRSRVVMARHGFGRGEYQYFSYPLPGMVAELRFAFYPVSRPSPIAGTRQCASTSGIRTRMPSSLPTAMKPGR